MFTAAFWTATGERSVRTGAQVLAAALGLDSAGLIHADWGDALSLAGGAALLAVLTAVATSGGPEGPGLTETVRDRRWVTAPPEWWRWTPQSCGLSPLLPSLRGSACSGR
ncbi:MULTISPECIES: holin [unclassified Streptomyces]|uniref:holin n=1 Tax=Streptomyces sp. NPDC127532 TaxID=3345399 RepID=UPI003643C07D